MQNSLQFRHFIIITLKHPDKLEYCREILAKDEILLFDVILLNKIIFGNGEKDTEFFNQQHKSYDEATINTILNYQKKHHLNNSEVSRHFKLSRIPLPDGESCSHNHFRPDYDAGR